jgi:hypothetical protein
VQAALATLGYVGRCRVVWRVIFPVLWRRFSRAVWEKHSGVRTVVSRPRWSWWVPAEGLWSGEVGGEALPKATVQAWTF